jgi:hypothetical protein
MLKSLEMGALANCITLWGQAFLLPGFRPGVAKNTGQSALA